MHQFNVLASVALTFSGVVQGPTERSEPYMPEQGTKILIIFPQHTSALEEDFKYFPPREVWTNFTFES